MPREWKELAGTGEMDEFRTLAGLWAKAEEAVATQDLPLQLRRDALAKRTRVSKVKTSLLRRLQLGRHQLHRVLSKFRHVDRWPSGLRR